MTTPVTKSALIALAAKASPSTKTAAKAALKSAGLPQTHADNLLRVVAVLSAARKSAPDNRLDRRLGYAPVDAAARRWSWPQNKGQRGNGITTRRPTHGSPGRAPARLPVGTPSDRLQRVRREAISNTYGAVYRAAAHGEVDVHLTDDPAEVGIRQVESLDWDLYRGAHKGKPARVQDTHITAPAAWRTRVQRANLAVLDGMMTLDAAPLDAEGCELYAATWLIQGRGTTTTAARGYIARAGGATYHGATIDQAINGLTKKRRELQLVARLSNTDALAEMASANGKAHVTLGDVRAVGACEYGTRSWCDAVGIDYEAGETTLGTVLQGYQREPRPEARAVIIRVLRRTRAHLQGFAEGRA